MKQAFQQRSDQLQGSQQQDQTTASSAPSVSCPHVRQERLWRGSGSGADRRGKASHIKAPWSRDPSEGNEGAASRTRGVINDGSGKANVPNSTLNPNGLSQPYMGTASPFTQEEAEP